MAMNPKVKADWVKALRSGQYKQVKGYLEKKGCNCCLGVLCRISDVTTSSPLIDGTVEFIFDTKLLPSSRSMVPSDFMGLSSDDLANLTLMNDAQGKSFNQIADYIENNPNL